MNRQLRELSSWRIVCELIRRYPNKFIVIETHPGGGTYDCLSFFTVQGEHCADFNRAGTFHVFNRFDALRKEDPCYDVWSELSRNHDYKEILDNICRMMGLKIPQHLPSSTPTVLVYRFIATFLSHSFLGTDYWECRNGMLDSSAPYECGGVKNDFDSFPGAKERLRVNIKSDVLNQPAYRFWFLKRNEEPFVCMETTGSLWTKNGKAYDLMEMYNKEKRIWPLIIQTAGNLLP